MALNGLTVSDLFFFQTKVSANKTTLILERRNKVLTVNKTTTPRLGASS